MTGDAGWYRAVADEVEIFEHCHAQQLPLLIKGPTGCGKSRYVEAMAARVGRPLITVACHDETSVADLLGRHLLLGGETVWRDGPVARALRAGAILYLDEIAEAREDVIVVLHPLTDHRRELFIDRTGELLRAPDELMVVVSYNPGYRRGFKELKPSTRQRFVSMAFDYPAAPIEAEIVVHESGVDARDAKRLVALAHKIRGLQELGLAEGASTRLLVSTGALIRGGLNPRLACDVGIVQTLTDDPQLIEALRDLANLVF